jgi:hypothetical protein
MQESINLSPRRLLRELMAQPDGILRATVALLSQPAPMRSVVDLVFSIDSWDAISFKEASVADTTTAFNVVALHVKTGTQVVGLIVSGDGIDVEAASKPSPNIGSLFIGGDVPPGIELLLEKMLSSGLRLQRRPRQHTRWYEFQVGRQPSPYVEGPPLPTRDNGYLRLLLGQDEDRAMAVQIAWGSGQSQLFTPGKIV